MGLASRHKELSPAMSQLIIAGHVKDGIEMAKEYGLPAVLRQFIETHHGTTLIEYFYNKAIEKHSTGAKSKKGDRDLNSGEQAGEQVPEKDQKTETAEREQLPPSETEFRYAGPKPRSKEAAIVMLADTVEGAVRASGEVTPTKIEGIVHNMAMNSPSGRPVRHVRPFSAGTERDRKQHFQNPRCTLPRPNQIHKNIRGRDTR